MDRSYIPYIADAVCVIVLALFMRFYAKKGLYNCLMPFIVVILSIAFAIYGSNLLTKPVTDKYVFPHVEKKVTEEFSEAFGSSAEGKELDDLNEDDLRSLDSGKLEELSEKIKEYAEKAGIDASKLDLGSLLRPDGQGSAGEAPQSGTSGVQSAKDKILAGLLNQAYAATTSVVHWVLIGVLAAVGLIVFNLLKRLVGLITHLPIISFFNALGGIVIGAAVFTVFIFIASRLLRRFGVSFLDDVSQGSYVLSWFMAL